MGERIELTSTPNALGKKINLSAMKQNNRGQCCVYISTIEEQDKVWESKSNGDRIWPNIVFG